MIKDILRLTRPKQWIKNFFVFIPMFFGGELFDTHSMWLTALTFFAFSLVASSIYCYNDIVDVDADRNHPVKCHRPIASVTARHTSMMKRIRFSRLPPYSSLRLLVSGLRKRVLPMIMPSMPRLLSSSA